MKLPTFQLRRSLFLLVVASFGLGCIVGYKNLVSDRFPLLEYEERQTKVLEDEYLLKAKKAAMDDEYRARVAELEQQAGPILRSRRNPDNADRKLIENVVMDLASKVGLRLTSWTPSAVKHRGDFVDRLQIAEIEFVGSYKGMLEFAAEVARSSALISIESMSIARRNEATAAKVSIVAYQTASDDEETSDAKKRK